MSGNKLTFVTVESSTRVRGEERVITDKELDVEEVSRNINRFIENLDEALKETSPKVGGFEFAELEIYAEVTAEGTFKVLGTGVGASAMGGLKFIFRRSTEQ